VFVKPDANSDIFLSDLLQEPDIDNSDIFLSDLLQEPDIDNSDIFLSDLLQEPDIDNVIKQQQPVDGKIL